MGSDNKPEDVVSKNEVSQSAASSKPNLVLFSVLTFAPALIGFGIGYAVYSFGATEKYDARIAGVGDMAWLYASIPVFGRAIAFVNNYPAFMFKGGWKGNLRSNPFIYKAIGEGASENAIIFDESGNVGKYNRANRSIHHMVENFGAVCAGLFASGTVFPFPTFVATCVFSIGRILHQIGYTGGYGKHAPGFLLSLLSSVTVEGLCSLVAVKSFGLV